jgi:hypothetical protein
MSVSLSSCYLFFSCNVNLLGSSVTEYGCVVVCRGLVTGYSIYNQTESIENFLLLGEIKGG